MLDFFYNLFDTTGFPPRWQCGAGWTAAHGWLHIASDLAIWGAYLTIPAVLLFFIRRRKDLPFQNIFWLFGAFILACGTTHLMDSLLFWWPAYRLSGLIKLITAVVSWGTVFALIRVAPRALALSNPRVLEAMVQARTAELERANAALESEIRERKRAERELSRLAAIVQSSEDAIIGESLSGLITSWNAGAERLYGYSSDEVLGKPIQILFPESERAESAKLLERLKRGEPNDTLQMARVRKDGRRIFVSIKASPIRDAEGRMVGISKIDRDVTDRVNAEIRLRLSEARYRAIVKTITSVEWTIDAQGRFQSSEPSWQAYTGQAAQQAAGWGWIEMLHPDERERFRAELQRDLQAGTPHFSEGRLWHAATGEYRYFVARAIPLPHTDNSVREWVGTCIDIHDRKRVELALRDADRRKDEFLAMLGHELRNPLAPIRNAVALLQAETAGSEPARELLDIMGRQVSHLVRLVDDLLDVSRIMRGRMNLRLEPVELALIVQQAVETTRAALTERNHELTISLPDEPVRLSADSIRLTQVFTNLLSNAAKYTPPGGHISLTAQCDRDFVVVRVRDDGEGIGHQLLPYIFDLFSQGDRSIERTEGGLGIGLTLVRRLVEMHGGTVTAHSGGANRGSEFAVRLPLSSQPVAPAQTEDVFTLKALNSKAQGSTECRQTRSRTLGTHYEEGIYPERVAPPKRDTSICGFRR
jgi:PAS domain S-box-containing protein